MTINGKDAAAGALFMALGAFYGLSAYFRLQIGTSLNMGPGYFPIMLSGILFILGLIIAVRAVGGIHEAWGATPWRGLALLLPGPVLFGATVEKFGFVPALGLLALSASYASRRMTHRLAAAVVIGLVVFCVVVFYLGLGSRFQLFGPWLSLWRSQ